MGEQVSMPSADQPTRSRAVRTAHAYLRFMVSVILATSRNHAIGLRGQLPWSVPEDLRRFRLLTTGHTVIMGRRTYESIGKPLPNRRNIVVSKTLREAPAGCEVAEDLYRALHVSERTERFIIGGARLFHEALDPLHHLAHRVYLTELNFDVEGDVFFEPNLSLFREVARERGTSPDVSFVDYHLDWTKVRGAQPNG